MLQYRLHGMSRTTQDIDGLVRGNIDHFLTELDHTLAEPWEPLTLVRSEVEIIRVPQRIIKPRRFNVTVQLRGATWRRVQVEISPDEGQAGAMPEAIPAPSLAGFGLPTPGQLTSLSMGYQIAQKVHACTDPHDPPRLINDRARDVVDLLLLRDLVASTGQPSLVRSGLRLRMSSPLAPPKQSLLECRLEAGRQKLSHTRTGGRASPTPLSPLALISLFLMLSNRSMFGSGRLLIMMKSNASLATSC